MQLIQGCHPTTSSSIIPFSSCLQFFPGSGSFLMDCLFASGGQSTGASASASVLPMSIQSWFPLELTGLISLQSKGPSRVFSNTTVQKHQFFGTQTSLWPKLHIQTWLLEKPYLWLHGSLLAKSCLWFLICYLGSGSDGKASVCNAWDPGSIPGLGRSPGEGNGNPLQYSCLENMGHRAW